MKLRTLSVSELTSYIARLIADDPILNVCTVNGELSSFKQYGSGHVYFNLVDGAAKLPCVMFRSAAMRQRLDFKIGDFVQVSGQLRVYEREGRYQLICQSLRHQGAGDLHRRFIELKASLEAKGYFDAAHKRQLGEVRRVGLITSPVGAAIKDFTSILARRNRLVEVDVYGSSVQGAPAVAQLIAGIDYFNRRADVDVIVLTRGGGSLEDLWCFNDVHLAEAIYQSALPIVSAVGHETDFTIADFVADLRAATPSAAAELIAAPLADLIAALKDRLTTMERRLSQRLALLDASLQGRAPLRLRANLLRRMALQRTTLNMTMAAAAARLSNDLERRRQTVERRYQAIALQNPQHILKRGYAYLQDDRAAIISSVDDVAVGQTVGVVLADGRIKATVEGIEHEKN